VRLGGATRGKWGILDGKDESGLMSDSELQCGIELCTDIYRIYGVLQT
jgi:hypothetical protein